MSTPAITPNGWIPCARELPDDDTTVLIGNEVWGGEVVLGYMEGHVWLTTDGVSLDGFDCSGNANPAFDPPTHWMHVPEFDGDVVLQPAEQKAVLTLTDKADGTLNIAVEFSPDVDNQKPVTSNAVIMALEAFKMIAEEVSK